MVLTLTNYGVFAVSGAALKTAVDGITMTGAITSGAGLYFVPTSDGHQINLLKVVNSG